MKWDVKHDRAKRVIDAFLDNADYWQDREDLSAGLTDEDKALVSEEVALMIASIRKRYKLQERLPEAAVIEDFYRGSNDSAFVRAILQKAPTTSE